MGYSVQERFQGRRPADGDRPTNEVPYLVTGDDSDVDDVEEDAKDALGAGADATLGGLKLLGWKIDERLNAGQFLGTATYGTGDEPGQKDTGDSSFSFDTTGGTFNVKVAKDQFGYAAGAGVAPDVKLGINASDDDVAGVDITIPQYGFSETHYIADDDVTDTYKGLLYRLTGTMNVAPFKGCDAGECLFLGARGSKRGRGDWEITFNFAASPNATALTVGDITDIPKRGWDYLWVRYEKTPLGAGGDKVAVMVPKHVYVAIVYDNGNFASLGIGT